MGLVFEKRVICDRCKRVMDSDEMTASEVKESESTNYPSYIAITVKGDRVSGLDYEDVCPRCMKRIDDLIAQIKNTYKSKKKPAEKPAEAAKKPADKVAKKPAAKKLADKAKK